MVFCFEGSVQIVSQHFGELLARMAVFIMAVALIYQLPMYTLNLLVKVLSANAPIEAASLMSILSVVSFILGTGIGLFGMVYSVITYQHAKTVTDDKVAPKLTWIWMVAGLGWVIFALLGIQLGKIVTNPLVQNKVSTAIKENSDLTNGGLTEQDKIANWTVKISPEAKTYFDISKGLFVQMKMTGKKQAEIKKLNDENIVALRKAVELDPKNPELWAALSDAYTWINSKATLNDALTASQKAEDLDPTIWGYMTRTAEIYLMQEKYDEAILKFQQVIRAEDNYARAHIGLGVAYKATGINSEAKIELQKGIDILTKYNSDGSFDSDILQARKVLGGLQ